MEFWFFPWEWSRNKSQVRTISSLAWVGNNFTEAQRMGNFPSWGPALLIARSWSPEWRAWCLIPRNLHFVLLNGALTWTTFLHTHGTLNSFSFWCYWRNRQNLHVLKEWGCAFIVLKHVIKVSTYSSDSNEQGVKSSMFERVLWSGSPHMTYSRQFSGYWEDASETVELRFMLV